MAGGWHLTMCSAKLSRLSKTAAHAWQVKCLARRVQLSLTAGIVWPSTLS